MKTGLCILGIAILTGVLVGLAIPVMVAQAQAPDGITFHVLENAIDKSDGLEVIPGDSPETIIIEGTMIGGTDSSGLLVARIQNLCPEEGTPTGTPSPTPSPTPTATGTPGPDCSAVDIYYQIQLSLSWVNTWYTEIYGSCCNYTDKNLAPWQVYNYGGSSHIIEDTSDRCGDPYTNSGSCTMPVIEGMIPAADIGHASGDPEFDWQEEFQLQNYADWASDVITTNYKITLSTVPIVENLGCEGQYNTGARLGHFLLNSTSTTGLNLQSLLYMNYPAPGEWYEILVMQSWKDNNAGADLRTVGIKTGTGGTWNELSGDSNVGCVHIGETYDQYYLQMGSVLPTFLRVWDDEGDFGANVGTLVIEIYAVAAYSPYPSDCELQYKVGDLIEQRYVPAQFQNGWALSHSLKGGPAGDVGPLLTRYYMLETIGGPANIGFLPFGGGLTWGADLGNMTSDPLSVPSLWEEISVAGQVTCVVHTDVVGHVKVFFPSDVRTLEQIQKFYYAFRVRDTGTYADNTGSLGYRLYEATLMQITPPDVPPTPTGCSIYSHGTTPVASLVIPAIYENGVSLPTLISGTLYALEVTGGPWLEGGSVDTYTVQISDDNGSTWEDLEHYPNLLCAAAPEPDGNHVIIYVYGASGKVWKARVNDGDANFSTNTGDIGLDVFLGVNSPDYWPNCQDEYSLQLIPLSEEQRKIPGNSSEGKAIPASSILGLARPYSIEITDTSKWYEAGAGDGSYLVDISADGGTNWVALEDYASLCTEQISDDGRFQIYFNAVGNNYKLRVRDGDADFLSNGGYVVYNLYGATSQNPIPGPGPTPPEPAPPEWVIACNERYARPDSFITWFPLVDFPGGSISIPLPRVGEWTDYLRSAITYYFAWCPQHTDALKSIGSVAVTKEPIASITSMANFLKSIQVLLESYQAIGGETVSGLDSQEPSLFSDTANIGAVGGDSNYNTSSSGGPWDLFMVGTFDPVTNIWFGGQLDMAASLGSTDLSVMDTYQALCSAKFYPIFGFAADPYCSLMSMMRFSKIVTWMLLGLDFFVAIWFLLKYFPSYLKKTWNLLGITKGTISRTI